ncbi:MAG TPA: conjugative transposon protein TraM [Pedobacter sp.]|nr:conjugative transposon protein TraM [Pedobacter sp.]
MFSSIRFSQPKYVIPAILFPFLCLFFYVYQLNAKEPPSDAKQPPGMQDQLGNVSPEIQKKAFDDKLEAFNQRYKEADGHSAVNPIAEDVALDSIDQLMKQRFLAGSVGVPYASGPAQPAMGTAQLSMGDQELAAALAKLNRPVAGSTPGAFSYPAHGDNIASPVAPAAVKEKDPMEIFKKQMAYMDSLAKAADPDYKAELERQKAAERADREQKSQPRLQVQKDAQYSAVFNTIHANRSEQSFITAVIDENITGYAGSRIRLRLLEDIRAGNTLIKKGTYLYALISGFGDQRVTLSVTSIFQAGKILPVKLDIYDADGMPGLYVPEAAFREFSKDLGGSAMQGVNLQGSSGNQFLMSSFDKVFQSTSSAIASMIRKNKAKIKYNSFIYLIDPQALQLQQQGY